MRKLLLALVVLVMLTGCTAKHIEGSLDELLDKVYEGYNDELVLTRMEINEENIEFYLGINDIEYVEGMASEPMIGSIPHSVVLLRLEDGADKEEIKSKILDNVNPNKWICVSVEANNVKVSDNGDLIILVMTNDNPDLLVNNFNNLK